MNEWKTTTVAELQRKCILLVEDGNHGEYRPRPYEFVDCGVSFIRVADMAEDSVLFESASKISDIARKRITKGIGAPNDVLLSHKGTVGKVAFVPDDAPPFVCSPQTTFWRTLDSEVLDCKYLYVLLKSPNFQAQLATREAETDMAPYVSLTSQRGLQILLPPIEKQRQIANYIFTLVDKIKINRRINQTLETIAQTLFKRWFVDFEFPNQEGKPYKSAGGKMVDSEIGLIPEGWKVCSLREAMSYYIGGGWGCENEFDNSIGACVIRGTDMPSLKYGNFDTVPFRFHKKSAFQSRKLEENDIILEISGGSKGQPVGRNMLLNKFLLNQMGNAICASFCKLMRFKDGFSPYYLSILLNNIYRSEEIMKYQLQSTGISNFNFEFFLDDIKIFIIPQHIEQSFDTLLEPLYDKIALNGKQNRYLCEIQNQLIPKLMSGKIRIPISKDNLEAT